LVKRIKSRIYVVGDVEDIAITFGRKNVQLADFRTAECINFHGEIRQFNGKGKRENHDI